MFNIDNTLFKLAEVTNKFMVCIGMDGNYTYTNNAYNTRFRFETDVLIGQPSLKDIHVDDHVLVVATVEKCLAQPNTAFDVIIRKPAIDGGYIYTQWDFIALLNEHNQPHCVMCIGMEITSFIEDGAAKHSKLQEIAYDQSHLVRRPLANILGLSQLLSDNTIMTEEERNHLLEQLHTVAQELDDVVRSVTSKAQEK